MFIELQGIRIFYEHAGEGERVFLFHGWGGQSLSFRPVFEPLAKKYHVFALDFPGFGHSGLPPEPWGVGDYGNLVKEFSESLGVKKAHIIGHSFGGRVAIWLAAHFPEMVGKLILVDSAGIRPKRTLKYYVKISLVWTGKKIFSLPFFGKQGPALVDRLYRFLGSKDYLQQTGIMRATLVKIVNQDLRGLLPKIAAPTLLIWGEKDEEVPLRYARIMEKEIRDSGLVVLKGAGHFSYLDRLPEFMIIVFKFLES